MYTIDQIKKTYDKRQYKYFLDKKFDCNVFGVRSLSNVAGKFDDVVGVFYKDYNEQEKIVCFKATTDPGTYWLSNPLNKDGTLIMLEGQYRGAYKIGIHGRTWASGGYKALEQIKPMRYVRDNNKDDVLDFNLSNDPKNIVKGVYKTNIHRASKWQKIPLIGKYSAGCQVVQSIDDFKIFIEICERQIEEGIGNSFTYTLLNEKNIDFEN